MGGMVSGLSGGLQPDGHAGGYEDCCGTRIRMAIGCGRPLTMPPALFSMQ